jgi:hypothetical protein
MRNYLKDGHSDSNDRVALSANVDKVLAEMGLTRQYFGDRSDSAVLKHIGNIFRNQGSIAASIVAKTAASAARDLEQQR